MSKYFKWSRLGWRNAGKAPYNTHSPNLLELRKFLMELFGGHSLGIFGVRRVRGGVSPSTHAYGAALDWRYEGVTAVGKHDITVPIEQVCDWLIANHERLHVQLIVDYVRGRAWNAERGTWRSQRPSKHGMGKRWAQWLHIETTPDGWHDATPIMDRDCTIAPGVFL